jgi:LacI family transcriptional regulator
MDYQPHRASQILVRNTVRTIAVFSSAMPEYFWDEIKKGVFKAAEQLKILNYEVHYHQIPDFDTKKYCALLSREIKNGLNAAAFVYQDIFDMNKIIGMVEKANIPYLLFNTDDADTGRLLYIGSNYRHGGRLAANFIGKALETKRGGKALVVGFTRKELRYSAMPNINAERLDGFLTVMRKRFPGIECVVEHVDSKRDAEQQVMRILKKYRNITDAVYFIPPYNDVYHRALERYDYRKVITLQHDIDDTALRYLESDLLTAVVFQDPVLQGYIVVQTLENILESKKSERLKDIEIAHTLILRENTGFLWNNYLIPETAE